MQGSVRGPPPPQDGRMGGAGPPGYVDDMSMEMGHMNVTSPPYNPNFPPDFYDGNMQQKLKSAAENPDRKLVAF